MSYTVPCPVRAAWDYRKVPWAWWKLLKWKFIVWFENCMHLTKHIKQGKNHSIPTSSKWKKRSWFLQVNKMLQPFLCRKRLCESWNIAETWRNKETLFILNSWEHCYFSFLLAYWRLQSKAFGCWRSKTISKGEMQLFFNRYKKVKTSQSTFYSNTTSDQQNCVSVS